MTFEAVMMQRRGALISANILQAGGLGRGRQRGVGGGGSPMTFEAVMMQRRGALISANILKASGGIGGGGGSPPP